MEGYYERINTIAYDRFNLIVNKVSIPAPGTKEEAKKLKAIYKELLKWYKKQIKEIETNILPRLDKELK